MGAWRAWILITAITAGYVISRGIAKSGTRSNAKDPREQMTMNCGHGNSSGSQDGRQQQRTDDRDQEEAKTGPWFG